MNLSWNDFKSIINQHGLTIFYFVVKFSNHVQLFAERNGVRYDCRLDQQSDDFKNFENDYMKTAMVYSSQVSETAPWNSKRTKDGKRIIRRKHGLGTHDVRIDQINVIDFEVPYDHCKIDELEIIGCQKFDMVSLKSIGGVFDIQVGFDMVLPANYYNDKSDYDADLYKGQTIRLEYKSETDKRVGFNITLHELM